MIELLESRVLGNLQARFGEGRMEKGLQLVARKSLRTPGSARHLASRLLNYKLNTPQGNYTYTAQGYGAQSYAGAQGNFLAWLNGVRAQYGLPAVGYDPNLENWAQMNNAQQNARGIGHYVMGPARRQNSAMGGYGSIGSMWMNSPGHRASLLDPTIRMIGLGGSGSYWTFNAY